MNEQLALLFAQLDIARMRYDRTADDGDLESVSEVGEAISDVLNAAPYPDWYDGAPERALWFEEGCFRRYERVIGTVHIAGHDDATPTGFEHWAGIYTDSMDAIDAEAARTVAADLLRAAEILDAEAEQ